MADDSRIYDPRYDITSASHFLRMPRSTLRAWVRGMGRFQNVIDAPSKEFVSFVNLTEAFVLLAMRKHYAIRLEKIRPALEFVRSELGVDHPLAFEPFETDGIDLFIRSAGIDSELTALNASRSGQMQIAGTIPELERIEWENDRPVALFPLFRANSNANRKIRISPFVAFGKPVIAGTGVPTFVVAQRFYAGESIEELADDYEVDQASIQEAVRAEPTRAA